MAEIKLPEQFKLAFGGVLPGETVIAAAFDYAGIVRETMSQDNRNEIDKLNLAAYRAWLALWGIVPDVPKTLI